MLAEIEGCEDGDENEIMMEEVEDYVPYEVIHRTCCGIRTSPWGLS